MAGREGLIYGEAYKWMDEHGIIRPKKRRALMKGLRVMEAESLRAWGERRSSA